VVNAVVVPPGPGGRLVIGTQQFGVLASDDGGETFHQANPGFSHRQILALAIDPEKSGRILTVLANAPEPVLVTDDDGKSWSPLGSGLRSEQVLRVFSSDKEWWAAVVHGGLLRYDARRKSWQRAGKFLTQASLGPISPVSRRAGSSNQSVRSSAARRPQFLQQIVHDMAFGSKQWYAATENGLLVSSDRGANWALCAIGPLTALPVSSVRVSDDGERLWIVSLRGLAFSGDGGSSWTWHDLPITAGGALSLETDPADPKTLVSIARNGLYISRDSGSTWVQAGVGLPGLPVQSMAIAEGIFVVSLRTGGLYVSFNSGRTWDLVEGSVADGTFSAALAGGRAGTILAASTTDGIFAVRWNPNKLSQSSSAIVPGSIPSGH
jgi:photosystem II stability/assembly factor-like uncharacterized protein